MKRRYEQNRERLKALQREYYTTNAAREIARKRRRRAEDPEKARQMDRAFRQRHKDRLIKKDRSYYYAHLEQGREYRRARREEKARYNARYRSENAHIIAAARARRHAAQKRATPSWADRRGINNVYRQAAEATRVTGVSHEVDHIVPMSSSLVCGLHVPWNLRVLTKVQNRAKGNALLAYEVIEACVKA